MKPIALSRYGRSSSRPSPVNRMMAEFARDFRDGIDINLGVGFVNEDTIPAEDIHGAMAEVIAHPERHRLCFNYGSPTGSENLIRSIRDYLIRRSDGRLTKDDFDGRQIIVGPNGSSSLLESVAYAAPKGIVITSDPMYYIYTHFLERLGFELLAIREDSEGPRIDLLRNKLDGLGRRVKRVRFIYVVTVSNPSCTILSNARRREIVDCAARLSERVGRKVPVIFDCAYQELVHGPNVEPQESALKYDPLGIVFEVGTLSKVLAPALRIGYLVGRKGAFMRALIQRTSDAGFSAPMITQEISSRLLESRLAIQQKKVCRGYREKAMAVEKWLTGSLGEEIETLSGGRAGFYYYLTFKRVETHERSDFFRFLTRTTGDPRVDGSRGDKKPRVIYIPGEHCVHPAGELAEVGMRQLRLSYGFEDLKAIRKAIGLMREALDHARFTARGSGARRRDRTAALPSASRR